MKSGVLRGLCLAALFMAAPASQATFHLIHIDEIYSNADGTVQYIVLLATSDSQERLSGHSVQTSDPGNVGQTFTFPINLPSNLTNNHRILIATQGFAALNLVAPDYVVPNGFVPTTNGTVTYASGVDIWTYTALPTDGVDALYAMNAVSTNLATNFAGASGTVIPAPTKLVITSVNNGFYPLIGQPFSVVVQARDDTGAARNVVADLAVMLSLNTGTGPLAGTLSCTIVATANTCTDPGVIYPALDTGVSVTASCSCGLASGNSALFNVIQFAGPTPSLVKGVSRKAQGTGGAFDLQLFP